MFLAVEFIIVEFVGVRTPIQRFMNPTYSIIVHSSDTQLVVRSHFVALRGLCVFIANVYASLLRSYRVAKHNAGLIKGETQSAP
jgi:hypothetical protein